MKPQDVRHLLGGYATGTLTKSEQEALMRAVLEDPVLFEEFVEEEDWRAALEDADFRLRLRRRLRELTPEPRRSFLARIGLTGKLRWLPVASAVAALAVIVLLRQGVLTETSPIARVMLGPDTIPALRSAGILEEPSAPEKRLESEIQTAPPPKATDAALNLDRDGSDPTYQLGERQRIGFRVAAGSNVLLLEERADGSVVRLFPNRFQSSTSVKPNETMLVPPAGQGDLEVDGPAGSRKLMMLVFPSTVDPLANGVDWRQVRGDARVVERKYEVK